MKTKNLIKALTKAGVEFEKLDFNNSLGVYNTSTVWDWFGIQGEEVVFIETFNKKTGASKKGPAQEAKVIASIEERTNVKF